MLKNFKLKDTVTGETFLIKQITYPSICTSMGDEYKINLDDEFNFKIIKNTFKKDKTGRDIWEDDIISEFGMGKGKVVWSESQLTWVVEIIESPGGSILIGSHIPLIKYMLPERILNGN